MKAFILSFAIWVFVVPVTVAMSLIFTFIATRMPDLYFPFIALALTFFTLAMAIRPSWLGRFSLLVRGRFQKLSKVRIQSRR